MNVQNTHSEFLRYVFAYVKENPEVAAYVSDYVSAGITEARKEDLQRAADMEVVAALAIQKRYKDTDSIILDKLQRWSGKTSLKWDSTLELLEKQIKK